MGGTYDFYVFSICESYQDIHEKALSAPPTTAEMLFLHDYMLNAKEKRVHDLYTEVASLPDKICSLLEADLLTDEDIENNSQALMWPDKVQPAFTQHTEVSIQ